MYKIKKLFHKSKNTDIIPLAEILESAKRSQIVYKTPDELEDIINDVDEHYLSSFIKTELNNTFVYYISDKITDAQLYIWIKNRRCYITFRGTSGKKDILKDLKITTEKIKDNIYVHDGFYDQFISIKETMYTVLDKEFINYDEFIISGHSLGGALAHLAVPFIREKYIYPITCFTFGSPRVGNKHFVQWFDNCVTTNYRVCNKNDIITTIPLNYYWVHTMKKTVNLDQSNFTLRHIDTPWYKRLFLSIKLINLKDPKKDHSCKYYIENLEYIFNTI